MTVLHASRSCVCFFGASLSTFWSAREMKTCIVLTSRSLSIATQASTARRARCVLCEATPMGRKKDLCWRQQEEHTH